MSERWPTTHTLLSPALPDKTRHTQHPKHSQTTIKDILLKFGRKQWLFGKEITRIELNQIKNWSSKLVSNAPILSCHLSVPMTPMNYLKMRWYDFAEVSRKIRKLWWTFWYFLPPTEFSRLFKIAWSLFVVLIWWSTLDLKINGVPSNDDVLKDLILELSTI